MMRKQWIYLQYPRFLFADFCFHRAKKTYLSSETVRAVLEEDMKKYLPKSLRDKKINNYSLNYLLANDKVFRNVFYFRLEQCKKTQSMISKSISKAILSPQNNIEIGINGLGEIGGGLRIVHSMGCVVAVASAGKNLTVHQGVTIGVSNYSPDDMRFSPVLGNNVTVFANAVVAGGITIGDNVVIGAGSVVMRNVPDNCTVIGNPAYIVKLNGKKVSIKL